VIAAGGQRTCSEDGLECDLARHGEASRIIFQVVEHAVAGNRFVTFTLPSGG